MTIATAIASSTFGLMLASISRSRMQLVAISNLAILLMSALGGSMYPRFLMPEKMQKVGLLTLNAWAIDGFQKIFWRGRARSRGSAPGGCPHRRWCRLLPDRPQDGREVGSGLTRMKGAVVRL